MSMITYEAVKDVFLGSRAEASKELANLPVNKAANNVLLITLTSNDIKAFDIWKAFIPSTQKSPAKAKNFLREGMMLNRAKEALFASDDWLESKDISDLAGFSSTNPSAQIHKWKKSGKIFSIKHNNVEYYPAYALNPENGYRPYAEIADIINAFGGLATSWKLAFWFNAKNSYLGGNAPKDIISNNPKAVVDAALIQAKGIQHG